MLLSGQVAREERPGQISSEGCPRCATMVFSVNKHLPTRE